MKDGTQQLPTSSRNALLRLAEMMRRGFSGEVRLVVHQGGIREFRESTTLTAADLRDDEDGPID